MTTANSNLHAAKRAKNDEFYTQFADIEREVLAYVDFNPDAFRGKTILLPCDDPEWSNFTKFFALKFDDLGLHRIISTSYNPGGRGKVFTIDHDATGDGRANMDDLRWEWLDGDGDFRSDEVRVLRDEADIIITNPPFSLFREFLAWITEADKKFSIIGSMNAITYKETFSLIKDNKMWLGYGFANGNAYFSAPDAESFKEYQPDTGLVKFRNVSWFTNIEHGRRHEPLRLMSMEDNLRFNKAFAGMTEYARYDNYDAIEVPRTLAIPSDYSGVMGVPISFLDKYNPDQFEIVGSSKTLGRPISEIAEKGTYQQGGPRFYLPNGDGTYRRMYDRIVIKHRNPA